MNSLTGRELAISLAAGNRTHAIIIEGERGCGKKTLAREMAAAMLCRNFDSVRNRPCGRCVSCLKIADGAHPDVTTVGAGAKTITVDEIRAVRTAAGIRPNEADARVFIVCDGQNMTVQAQNALLKILEEPPRSVRFIITCDNMDRMLETIVSRAVPVRIEGFTAEQCELLLAERFPERPREELRRLVQMFEGNIGRCIEAHDPEGSSELLELSERIYGSAKSSTGWELLELLARFEKDKDGFVRLLELLRLRCRCTGEDPREDLRRISMVGAIDRASDDISRNVYFPLVLATFSSALRRTQGI